MRHLATVAAIAAAVTVLAACGTSSAPANGAGGSASTPANGAGGSASTPATAGASCRAQFEAWRHGPAKAAAEKLIVQFEALKNTAAAADIPRMNAAIKDAGKATAALQAYPMPHCADPHGYWAAILTRFRSAADNASSSSLGALLLAIVPLKQVPGLLHSLGTELKQTAGASTAFG